MDSENLFNRINILVPYLILQGVKGIGTSLFLFLENLDIWNVPNILVKLYNISDVDHDVFSITDGLKGARRKFKMEG